LKPPICPYCKQDSKLVKGDTIYPHQKDLHAKSFYLCAPCNAWVGCHPSSIAPLGILADKDLRRARRTAHLALDPLWRNDTTRRQARARTYNWLSRQLCIPLSECHIGMFDLERCSRTVQLCEAKGRQT
jgi:hypothetical protein